MHLTSTSIDFLNNKITQHQWFSDNSKAFLRNKKLTPRDVFDCVCSTQCIQKNITYFIPIFIFIFYIFHQERISMCFMQSISESFVQKYFYDIVTMETSVTQPSILVKTQRKPQIFDSETPWHWRYPRLRSIYWQVVIPSTALMTILTLGPWGLLCCLVIFKIWNLLYPIANLSGH